jgi:Ca2+-binding RTX toxin-like protein
MIRVIISRSGIDWSNAVPVPADVSAEEYAALASRTVFIGDDYVLDLSQETDTGFTYEDIVGKTIAEIRFLFPAESEADFKQLVVSVDGTGDFDVLGSASFETLVGGTGSDTLTDGGPLGGIGFSDYLYGGEGDDIYRVSGLDTEALEYVTTSDGVADPASDAGGNDRIIANSSYFIRAGTRIETLELSGAGFGAGNDFANTLLADVAFGASLLGRGGDDVLRGSTVTDILVGGEDDDRLAGGGGSDVFLFNGEARGSDLIEDFGLDDLLVTTTRLHDSNNDSIIDFGSNRILDFASGCTVAMRTETGAELSRLEFDGSFAADDVTYYVYSRRGSAAGVEFASSLDYSDTRFFDI